MKKLYHLTYTFLNTECKITVYSLSELAEQIERILVTPEIIERSVDIWTEEKKK